MSKIVLTPSDLDDKDFEIGVADDGGKIVRLKSVDNNLNVPPLLITLKGGRSCITTDSRVFMRRLFVNPVTGHGFLRLMFTPRVASCDNAYDMTDFPPCHIRASELVDDGAGEVYLLAGSSNKIGFNNLTVGKTYHVILHGFWDLSGVNK